MRLYINPASKAVKINLESRIIKLKELQTILIQAHSYFSANKKCVLVTIVKIEGSGYRRQGTRMLISESGKFTGAISGGCVEKEVWLQSREVFKSNKSKLITYDGRYRLGCEGTLYILIEPISITDEKLSFFNSIYLKRTKLDLNTFFSSNETLEQEAGTYFITDKNLIPLGEKVLPQDIKHLNSDYEVFKQTLNPAKNLLIFGSEHDSVSLCKMASEIGWDVTIVAHPLNEKQISYFPGAKKLIHLLPEELHKLNFDQQTACILMSHSFSRDFAYLLNLIEINIPYIGLLGPHKRKNQILDQLIEQKPEVSSAFLDAIYGPVGLDIGAETPTEIAISILAELQAVFTDTEIDHLRDKSGSIHDRKP